MATFSFELYPPRSSSSAEALYRSLDRLVETRPEFISVTYGANGSSRELSLDVVSRIVHGTSVEAMAHLTCVGSSFTEASRLIREFLDAGVTSFLALRGDPPTDGSYGQDDLGDLSSAGELVQLIHRVQAERSQFGMELMPGTPGAARITRPRKVTIAVAAYPNGHPRSRSARQDIDTLLAKQAAGANLAITQLFFYADQYLSFVERAREAGVTMRILPGVMPVLSRKRLTRILDLTDEATPHDLRDALDGAADLGAQKRVGIDHAVRLSRDLLAGGASGLHLYTFNQHEPVIEVLDGVGLLDRQKEDA